MSIFSTNQFFKTRKDIYIRILLVFALILLISLPVSWISFSFDVTKENKFSLSDYTMSLINSTTEPILINFYVSKNLPIHIKHLESEVLQLLKQFSNHSNNQMVSYKHFIKPLDNESLEFFYSAGLKPFQANIYDKDSIEISEVFCGVIIYYQDKTFVLPIIDSMKSLEYDIALGIRSLLQDKKPSISIFTQNTSQQAVFQQLFNSLTTLYHPTFHTFESDWNNTSDLAIFITPGQIPSSNIAAIHSYLSSGGSAIFLIDKYRVSNLQATPKHSDIYTILNPYGIQISDKLIADTYSESVEFQLDDGSGHYTQTYRVRYDLWPVVSSSILDSSNPSVAQLTKLVFPWTSPVYVSTSDSFKSYPLIQSSDSSYFISSPSNLSPPIRNLSNKSHPAPIAQVLSKKFDNTTDQRLIVFGGSYFSSDSVVDRFPDNLNLLSNLIDWTLFSSESYLLPKRLYNFQPLHPYSSQEKTLVLWLTYLFTPLLCLILYFLLRVLRRV